jgi:LPS export ABC transporter permease LptF/LPS export ABC transporter permease LptG
MSSAALQHPPPKHRRPRLTLYRYVAREALRPTFFGLLGLTAIVLTTNILGFSDLVINRGVGGVDVGKMIFYEAVPVAARIFPFAVLIGCLVALGRMGADREILVLEASGVAAARLVWPVVSFAGAMSIVALLLSVYATPWANASFDVALEQISRTKPWAQLRAGSVNEFGGWQLEAREVSAAGDELKGVLLWIPEVGETIFARQGTLAASDDGAIEVTLLDGSLIPRPDEAVRLIRFQSATTILPESDTGLEREPWERLPGLPLHELARMAREFEPIEAEPYSQALLELHRRFAYPAATLVFGFLAVPLFVTRGNYSRSGGGVIGLVCTLAYYGLMQLAEGLVQGGAIGVVLGAWLPNLVLACLAMVLLFRALSERVVGHSFDRPRASEWRLRLPWRGRVEQARPRALPHRYAMPRYVAGRFLNLALLSFAVLFVAYLLIDMMDRLAWFTRHDATAFEVLRFYGARVWLLASRAVPMALLVGTSLTVSLLAVEGELIGMRACGISSARALLPVLMIVTLIAPLYLLLNNVVVPRTNALADELKRTEIKDAFYREHEERQKAGFWFRSGSQLLEAARFDPDLGQAREVTIYGLGADGLPLSRTDAGRGRHIGQGWWRLSSPTRLEVTNGHLERVPAPRHAHLGDTVSAEVDTMHLAVHEIGVQAREIEADGFDATPFWVDYHVRLAEPISCILLPAVVLIYAVTGPPFPGPASTLLVSGIIGVSYILLVALSSSLGRGGVLPPGVSAWGPVVVFAVVAGWFGARLWRRL